MELSGAYSVSKDGRLEADLIFLFWEQRACFIGVAYGIPPSEAYISPETFFKFMLQLDTISPTSAAEYFEGGALKIANVVILQDPETAPDEFEFFL